MKAFKEKRKHHYNEYSNVKLARKLIEQELKDLEDGDNTAGLTSETSTDTQVPSFHVRFN